MQFNDKYKILIEKITEEDEEFPTQLKNTKREYFPKKIKLSNDFIRSVRMEYKRLIKECETTQQKKNVKKQLIKSLNFLI